MKQDILNLENKNVGSIELNDAIFGLEVRADILHRVVKWQLARYSQDQRPFRSCFDSG